METLHPPAEMTGEALDEAVAREVFGLTQAQIDAWPWGVPPVSSDRNLAAVIPSLIWPVSPFREAMDRHLSNLPRLKGGPTELLMTATPDEICRAAIGAARECGPIPAAINAARECGSLTQS